MPNVYLYLNAFYAKRYFIYSLPLIFASQEIIILMSSPTLGHNEYKNYSQLSFLTVGRNNRIGVVA